MQHMGIIQIQKITLTSIIILFLGAECVAETVPSASQETTNTNNLNTENVDCVLPHQLRKTGDELPRLAPRRIVQTNPEECKKRGGEVVIDNPTH